MSETDSKLTFKSRAQPPADDTTLPKNRWIRFLKFEVKTWTLHGSDKTLKGTELMVDEKVRRHGTFRLHGLEVWGELILSGENSQLRLRTEEGPTNWSAPEVMHGRLHDSELVSCIHCVGESTTTRVWDGADQSSRSWSLFPHQVLSGRSYFDPCQDRIGKVWFSTDDIYRIFDDFDSFGILAHPDIQLQSSVPQMIGDRQVPIGPEPHMVYFAGRSKLLGAQLSFGKFEVQHWLSSQSNSQGARITTQIRVQVEFESALTLNDCLGKVASIGQFLSLVAGRAQGIENLQVAVDGRDSHEPPLSVHWSLGPRQISGQELNTPSWIDMPLDGIRRADEFRQVIERWFSSNEHAVARARLYSCRQSDNQFDIDRLVKAANMFDLANHLTPAKVANDLANVRDKCISALRTLPSSDDRDSAIRELKRIGAPTLTSKVLSRAAMLRGHFHLEDLDKMLRQAVLCRNYFVHGPGDKRFNYAAVQGYTPFLTETLEFVFAAAELIECGWAAGDWRLHPHTGHHWFSRFTSDYRILSQELLSDLKRTKKQESLK